MSKINTHNTLVGIFTPKISAPTHMKCYYSHNISQYFDGNTYTKNIKHFMQSCSKDKCVTLLHNLRDTYNFYLQKSKY